MPGKNPPEVLRHYYNSAYDTWKTVWEAASFELQEMPHKLDSTEFIRQDEVLAVFQGRTCTSLGFWTELDFTYRASREDFYFHRWTPNGFAALVKDGDLVGKYSYLTVAKEFRKANATFPFSFKDLQIGVFVKRFQNSDSASMTGTTRNNKGVNQVCARGGAVLIESNLEQYGVAIDLMAWYKNTAIPYAPIKPLVEFLWKNRIDYRFLSNSHININEGDLSNEAHGSA